MCSLVSSKNHRANPWKVHRKRSNGTKFPSGVRTIDALIDATLFVFIVAEVVWRDPILYDYPRFNSSVTPEEGYALEGKKGYVFLTSVYNASYATQSVYVNVRGPSSEYVFHFVREPESGEALLEQLNCQGQQGYRLKRTFYYRTGNIVVYIKDMSREDAKYVYRYTPPPNQLDVFVDETVKQGLDGYRYLRFYNRPGFSSLYIKDLSGADTSYDYKILPLASSSEQFIVDTNELSEQGYRFVRVDYIVSQTEKTPTGMTKVWNFALYYKDVNGDASYSYKVLPNANAFPAHLDQLNEQAESGYIFIQSSTFGQDNAFIYLNWAQCNCEYIDIDGGF